MQDSLSSDPRFRKALKGPFLAEFMHLVSYAQEHYSEVAKKKPTALLKQLPAQMDHITTELLHRQAQPGFQTAGIDANDVNAIVDTAFQQVDKKWVQEMESAIREQAPEVKGLVTSIKGSLHTYFVRCLAVQEGAEEALLDYYKAAEDQILQEIASQRALKGSSFNDESNRLLGQAIVKYLMEKDCLQHIETGGGVIGPLQKRIVDFYDQALTQIMTATMSDQEPDPQEVAQARERLVLHMMQNLGMSPAPKRRSM